VCGRLYIVRKNSRWVCVPAIYCVCVCESSVPLFAKSKGMNFFSPLSSFVFIILGTQKIQVLTAELSININCQLLIVNFFSKKITSENTVCCHPTRFLSVANKPMLQNAHPSS
jgi:hypothetical protein